MLVLSRKPGQRLQIGDQITITVLEVHGQSMRLGIEAPRDVRVLRGELDDWHVDRNAESRRGEPALAAAV